MLFNLLRAYAVYDEPVGYSQGMSYVVALLMLHIPDEERVFWCFVRLMKDNKYNLRHFFVNDCANLSDVMLSFEVALARHHPKLAAHLVTSFLTPRLQYSRLMMRLHMV